MIEHSAKRSGAVVPKNKLFLLFRIGRSATRWKRRKSPRCYRVWCSSLSLRRPIG
jgi:hypothetical protein